MQSLHGNIIVQTKKMETVLNEKIPLSPQSPPPSFTNRKPTEKVTYPQLWVISYGKGGIGSTEDWFRNPENRPK